MAELYRKTSLERISSPEQLDKVLRVSSPLSWLALIGVTLIVVVTVVWSIVGTIPVTITTRGIVSSVVGSNAVYTQEAGTVLSVHVKTGDELHFGDPVVTLKTMNDEVQTVFSDQVGVVAELTVKSSDEVTPGTEVARVAPIAQGKQVVICYCPLSQAKKLERGMKVRVSLDSVDSQSYGYMVARVINIDTYAASTDSMNHVLGSGSNLASTFLSDGAVVAVACEFYPDAGTSSGYYWSNEKGAKVSVTNGSLVTAKIITEEIAPITKLFSKINEIWGG